MTSSDIHVNIAGAQFLRRPLLGGQMNFPVALAPMVGLSHVALRRVVRAYQPAGAVTMWPTEMLSSWRLPRETLGATAETFVDRDEGPLVPQILGNEEEPIAESMRRLLEWGAVGVDINMGCPVKKALKHNYGVALMGDPEYAAEVVRMTVRHAAGRPVSVKLRAGLSNDVPFLLSFVRGLEAAGAAWFTLHPRVGHMKRRGSADWEQIRSVREQVSIPVIGNGDVQCVDDFFLLSEASGCDAVMVGRALAARPWMLWQIGERLGFGAPVGREGERAPATPLEEGRESGRAHGQLLDALEQYFPFEEGAKRLRFHVRTTCGWLAFGQHLFALVSRAKSYEEMRANITSFFACDQAMVARTSLRE